MPPPTIVQSLAYINWTLLVALAVGSFAVVVALRLGTDATRGYLGFTCLCSALLAALALLTDLGLPAPAGLAIVPAPELDAFRRASLAAFVVLSVVYLFALARGHRAPLLGGAGLAAGLATFVLAALGWGDGVAAGVPLLIQLLVLAGAAGGSLAGLILSHWYLVTPRLSERPLVVVARALTAVVGLQLLLFAVWVAIGPGPTPTPFQPLFGDSALFVWLRLLIGLLFPFVVSWAALRTARTRSMESATGLLYIGFAAIASGTIVAAGLYFASGLLV